MTGSLSVLYRLDSLILRYSRVNISLLLQDGLTAVVPHITTRKVSVRIQDFCNLLGGGLTSLSTIHADTVAVLGNMSAGAVICVYTFDPADVQVVEKTGEATEDAADLPVIFDEVPEKKAVKTDGAASEEAVDATKGTTFSSPTPFTTLTCIDECC